MEVIIVTTTVPPRVPSWQHPSNLPVLAALGLVVIAATVVLTLMTVTQEERAARADAQACEAWRAHEDDPAFAAAMGVAAEPARALSPEDVEAIRRAGLLAHRLVTGSALSRGGAEVFRGVSVAATALARRQGTAEEFLAARADVASFCGVPVK